MRFTNIRVYLSGLYLITLCLTLIACDNKPEPQGMALQDWLGGEADARFKRAIQPRPFTFPKDHGAHPQFRNEWWYLTGNVSNAKGQEFGYQVTFFRIGISADKATTDESHWASNQLWMAHIALSDIAEKKHHHEQRLAREAIGLAGSQLQPSFKVWLEDWQLIATSSTDFPWKVHAKTQDFTLDLQISEEKPWVLQGNKGLSQKGKEPGNASYYYSYPRLNTTGTITVNNKANKVQGLSWFDREWSTSALDKNQLGWDWFALQLNDGVDVMYYQFREQSGKASSLSSGKWIANDGSATSLSANDVRLEPIAHWEDKQGRKYPIEWRFEIPGMHTSWIVKARFADQVMDTGIRYWEGAVEIIDVKSAKQLGKGYLEMTGY